MQYITDISQLDLNKEYTYSDYLHWRFQERVELIRGFLKKMSRSPSNRHQRVSANLSGLFYNLFKNQHCSFFAAPFDVRLPVASAKKDTTVVQPDLCVICDESILDEHGCNGVPDLIVEIISKHNPKHDIDTKFKLYQEVGVKEYWIIEPYDKILFVYELRDGKYVGLKPQTLGEQIISPLFPSVSIQLDDVFFKVN
jgi:Uma2 family endonuclease